MDEATEQFLIKFNLSSLVDKFKGKLLCTLYVKTHPILTSHFFISVISKFLNWFFCNLLRQREFLRRIWEIAGLRLIRYRQSIASGVFARVQNMIRFDFRLTERKRTHIHLPGFRSTTWRCCFWKRSSTGVKSRWSDFAPEITGPGSTSSWWTIWRQIDCRRSVFADRLAWYWTIFQISPDLRSSRVSRILVRLVSNRTPSRRFQRFRMHRFSSVDHSVSRHWPATLTDTN